MSSEEQVRSARDYFLELQNTLCSTLETIDGKAVFSIENVTPPQGGLSQPRVLDAGRHIERAAVQFTHSIGNELPFAATERNPELRGKGFQATAISMIVHPLNPYVPTMHANLRFFVIEDAHWYFGGGFDLTPYYPFEEDILHWHGVAKKACDPFGETIYRDLKKSCDSYFYLPHRQEHRGVGGIFFDDWTQGGFERSFEFVRSLGDHILPAYQPILARRMNTPYGPREEEFQLYRRGRYAEFNLAVDRGTRYGMQSGRRIESVLASMPPRAIWKYNWQAKPGSPEEKLTSYYLKPRDWL